MSNVLAGSAVARVAVTVRPLCVPCTLIDDTSSFQRDTVSAVTVVLTLITAGLLHCYTALNVANSCLIFKE